MRSTFKHFALGPFLWRSVEAAEAKEGIKRTTWQQWLQPLAFMTSREVPYGSFKSPCSGV
jgi:hypothetical protein